MVSSSKVRGRGPGCPFADTTRSRGSRGIDGQEVGEMGAQTVEPGCVYLVGAGPGDPGLITRRGVECLARADVILVDYLVNPALLEHAPRAPVSRWVTTARAARCRPRRSSPGSSTPPGAGQTVVRLKGGDPSVLARESDEVGGLRAAGILLEIVPGITSGLTAVDCAGITEAASAVAIVTGRQRPGQRAGRARLCPACRISRQVVVLHGGPQRNGARPCWPRAGRRRRRWPSFGVAPGPTSTSFAARSRRWSR